MIKHRPGSASSTVTSNTSKACLHVGEKIPEGIEQSLMIFLDIEEIYAIPVKNLLSDLGLETDWVQG